MLPVLSQCDDVEYTSNAEAMYKIIQKYFTKNEMEGLTIRFYKEIIEKLLTNVYDRDFFESLCMFRFDIQKEVDMVDLKGLNQCLEYLKKEVIGVSPSSFLTTLCQRKPSAIENLLMNSKTRVQVATIPEQQLQYLLQYCVLVNQLFEFLATAVPTGKLDIKGFLIRDVVHFLCNLIVNESGEFLKY